MGNSDFFKAHMDRSFTTVSHFACEGGLRSYMVEKNQVFTIAAYVDSAAAIFCLLQQPLLNPCKNLINPLIDSINGPGAKAPSVSQIHWSPKGGLVQADTAFAFAIVGEMTYYANGAYFSLLPDSSAQSKQAPKTVTTASLFPHVCKKCSSPAYYGFNKMECSNTTCTGGW